MWAKMWGRISTFDTARALTLSASPPDFIESSTGMLKFDFDGKCQLLMLLKNPCFWKSLSVD